LSGVLPSENLVPVAIPSPRLPSTHTVIYPCASKNLRLGMADPNRKYVGFYIAVSFSTFSEQVKCVNHAVSWGWELNHLVGDAVFLTAMS
jgi:hypothetical protein